MLFNPVFTEEAYNLHLQFLDNSEGEKLNLRDANLQCTDLQGADLRRADLQGTDLRGADLRGADLRGARLQGTDLRGARLQGTDLRRASLQGADLQGAYLRVADLRGARLQDADLQGTNLQDADLQGTDLRDADLRDADLRDTDLRNSIGNCKEIKSLQFGTYLVVLYLDKISIGCQTHTREEWFNFDDLTISKMDTNALDWWKVYKPILQMICEANPAVEEKK
jgi:uncharacterized protein YjbI with pentapeptide repeats